MSAPGRFRITSRRSLDAYLDPSARSARRRARIVLSLRKDIAEGGGNGLRIRQVVNAPREVFRLELELPDLGYQRTTLLDRRALEALLEAEEVRRAVNRI